MEIMAVYLDIQEIRENMVIHPDTKEIYTQDMLDIMDMLSKDLLTFLFIQLINPWRNNSPPRNTIVNFQTKEFITLLKLGFYNLYICNLMCKLSRKNWAVFCSKFVR